MDVKIFPGQEELSEAAAKIFVSSAREAISDRNKLSVAFCGGNTLNKFFELLAALPFKKQVLWRNVHVFWTDEQWVFHNDLRNNAKIAYELLLDHVPLPPQQICRISGELGPLDSAMQYEYILQEFFANEPPNLDLVFLNLGEDGHILSLLPGADEVLFEEKGWVKAIYHSEQKLYRITLTPNFINNARKIVILISGSEKASFVKKLLSGKNLPEPAELIAPRQGELIYLLDREAASELNDV